MPPVHYICGSCADVLIHRRSEQPPWKHRDPKSRCAVPSPVQREGPPPPRWAEEDHEPEETTEAAPEEETARRQRQRWTWEEWQIDRLREAYDEHASAGKLPQLAEELGFPVYVVRNKGRRLGLSKPHRERRGAQKSAAPKAPPSEHRLVKYRQLPIEVSPVVYRYLENLVRLGLHGRSIPEVAQRLVAQRVEQLIVDQFDNAADRVNAALRTRDEGRRGG